MRPLARRRPILAVLVALLVVAGEPAHPGDCNRNGIEDLIEIETPAVDFRLGDEVEVRFPSSLAALDFDGDGDLDLAVDTFDVEGLVLLRNDGAAGLARADNIPLPRHPQSLRSADLDGDSDLDLVLALQFELKILWNDGDGTFSRTTHLPVGSGPIAVEAAHLDGDADLDLITANFLGTAVVQNVSVLLNEGRGTFAPARNFASAPEIRALSVADLDGDGDADALLGALGHGDLVVLENDGRARFRPAGPSHRIPELRLTFLATADIDGDGRDEVLPVDGSPRVLVLSHVGGGRFDVKDQVGVPGTPVAILARDVTGDGRLDLLVASVCPDFTVLEGGPDGFREPRSFWLGLGLRRLIAAHLNGDGLLDLAGSSFKARVFSMIQEPSRLSLDCNRNGIPDGCDADCDRNGRPDDCDLSSGASPDCDANGIPDACDPDCNANGFPDACDIGAGRAADCDGNGVPDGCEHPRDADGNGSPDACDIARDPALDCDRNGKLDQEDLEPPARFAQEEQEFGMHPRSGRLADLDGDGDEDIVAGSHHPGISILEQLEDGSFARARTYEPDVLVQAVAVLDADRDGDLDIAMATPDQACEFRGWVSVLLNHGGFRFGRGPAYDLEATPGFLEPADLDGDGVLDLLAAVATPAVLANVWALPGHGDGTFAEPLRIGEGAGSPALSDFDADGDIDIAWSSGAILLNEGGGTFIEGPSLEVNGDDIAAGDIDGDLDTDLVIRIEAALSIFVNDGRSRFTPGRSLSPESWTGPLALGNFDGDGRADVALATLYYQFAVSVLLSRDTSFVEVSPVASVGALPSRLLVGDLTRDGLDDVVALLPDAGSAVVLENRGNGLLSSRAGFALEQVFFSIELGDVDGDLDLDIAAVVYDPSEGGPRIALFENDGNASYSLRALLAQEWQPGGVRLGDVDGDGLPDLVVEEREDAGMGFSILENQGGWSFGLEFHGPRGPHAADLAVMDFDADGDLDVARLLLGTGQLSVTLNDGGSMWGDPVVTLTGLHSSRLHAANVDGDGLPDLLTIGLDEIWVHRGAGGGRFKAPAEVVSLSGEISSATAADIDADGDDDLVVGRTVADCARVFPSCWRLNVYLNVRGALVISEDHAVDGTIHTFAPADIEGDGDFDILAGIATEMENTAAHVRLFVSSGGDLRRGSRITLGGGGSAWVAARDLDGDGDADVLSSTGAGFSVIRNDTPRPTLRDADRDGVPDECEREPFSRGDADQDGASSLSDAIGILGVLFQGSPLPACPSALDADDSGKLDITDPVRILGHLFLGGGPLPEPFAACGPDPTPDDLACSRFGPCP